MSRVNSVENLDFCYSTYISKMIGGPSRKCLLSSIKKKIFEKNLWFFPKIVFYSKNGHFHIGLIRAEHRNISRIVCLLLLRRLRQMRAPPTTTIRRYGHFSDRQSRQI